MYLQPISHALVTNISDHRNNLNLQTSPPSQDGAGIGAQVIYSLASEHAACL